MLASELVSLTSESRDEYRHGAHECFPARRRAKIGVKTKDFALCFRGCARHDASARFLKVSTMLERLARIYWIGDQTVLLAIRFARLWRCSSCTSRIRSRNGARPV